MSECKRFDLKRQHFAGEEGKLIPLLQQAQAEDGYLKPERLKLIHEQTGIPVSDIYGVATFYAQFRFKPVGKNLLRICHGTACHVSGAMELTDAVEAELGIASGETTSDELFSIEPVACLGCCSLAPVIMINDTTYANLTPAQIKKVINSHREGEKK